MTKYLLSALLLVCLQACHAHDGRPIITYKSHPDSACICEYGYFGSGFGEEHLFHDSCNFYHVGDTLYPAAKKKEGAHE